MPDQHPNILLIVTDQQRGDCLGIDGHPVLQTPTMDFIGASGTFFRRGYSECPSCIPARRVLMSGQAPGDNGMVGMTSHPEWDPAATLAGELRAVDYETRMIGKLHLQPNRRRFGFDAMELANGTRGKDNDYLDWLHGEVPLDRWAMAHGVTPNGWIGRPSHLPEERTHTFWVVSRAIEYLEKRDPSGPFFLNISFIACAVLFRNAFAEPAHALVLGAWLGGIAQLVAQYVALVRVSGIRYPSFELMHPGIRKVLFLLIPVLIGQSAGEVNRLVDTLMAYSLPDEGTVSSLFIANRLVQLPLSIFAVATSVAILPTLSRLHTKKDYDELRSTLLQGLRQSFYFIMPAMAGLFILGQPVISLLFERGEFDATETSRAATALAYYAGGLLAFAWVKVTVTGFYAMQDTRSPVIIASCAMLFNILLNFALIGPLGYKGLALSTTISYSLNCLALYALLNHRIGGLWHRDYLESLIRIILATAFMSSIAYGTWLLSTRWFDDTVLLGKLAIALLPIAASIIAYAILSKAFAIKEFDHFLEGLKRRSER